MDRFQAQFMDSKFKKHNVFAPSIVQLKRKLRELDVLASATICDIKDPSADIIFYKPRMQQRKK